MKKTLQKALAVIVLGLASMTFASSAVAQDEWPFTNGDYWEVTGIKVADGGAFKYSKWLATEWRKQLEFAKSKQPTSPSYSGCGFPTMSSTHHHE